jgi:hypothetical protein
MTDIKRYAELFSKRLRLIQKYSEHSHEVKLCFAPIGTNTMFLASELLIGARLGFRTKLVSGVHKFDQITIRDFNEEYGTNHTLEPWVLQRYDDHYDNPKPWTIWFRDLEDNDVISDDPENDIRELDDQISSLRPRLDDPYTLELALCVRYVLRFNQQTLAFLDKSDEVGDKNCIAVHIRRGDACSEDLSNSDPNRKHFALDAYAKQMEAYIEQGFTHFFVLTESQQAIDWLKETFAGRAQILNQELVRNQFTDLSKEEEGQHNFIEVWCLDKPEFLKFTLESALVDIYNAQKCQGLIGTMSSQFSVLNYLNILGKADDAYLSDLAKVDYKRTLFHPSIESNKGINLLVIKERDVGLFSLILQVVNTLLCIEEQNLAYMTYVDFGEHQSYYTGSNTWDLCFENLFLLNQGVMSRSLPSIDASYQERAKTDYTKWDRHGKVYKEGDGLYWTASYYPKLGKQATLSHIDHQRVPTDEERRRAAMVIGKYFKPKQYLINMVNEFCDQYFKHEHVLGVQFRGSDAREDFRRRVANYDQIIERVKDYVGSKDHTVTIFLASDEQSFIDAMKSEFDDVCAIETVRHNEEDGSPTMKGPLGQGMPSFINKDKNAALVGVMLDYMLMCRCNHLIHCLGSVTNAVLLTNPDITSELIGDQYKSRGQYPTLVDNCIIEYDDGFVTLTHPKNESNTIFVEESVGKFCELCDGWNVMPKVIEKLNCQLAEDEQWDGKKLNAYLERLVARGFIAVRNV